MRIPDVLMDVILRRMGTIVAELEPIEENNRAWVLLVTLKDPLVGRDLLARPGSPVYSVHRFELPRSIVEDEMSRLHEPDYFVHREMFRTQDIAEAFEKAAEYEPDWSKWGTRQMHPDCP